jgi:Fur family transcriptional regulator, ferric uptake regulator
MLREAGLRRTPVRLGVLEVLGSSGGQPVGVPQVLEKLPQDTDAVTVYRTLNTFTRTGLVHRVRGEDRTWRYALSPHRPTGQTHGRSAAAPETPSAAHGHPHFVCDGCGTLECLEKSQIPKDFVRSLRVGSRYDVRYPEVVLHGLCPRCNA